MQLGQEIKEGHIKVQKSSALHLVVEKIPFFALAAIASVAAYITQHKGGAVPAMDFDLLKMQTANAIVSYVSYIGKMIWPGKLAAYYPHPGMLPVWQVVGAGLLIVCVSVFGVWKWRKFPYFTFGWFWFLGTFVPVIGFVKIGNFLMADRYTYVPLIGIFIIIAWGVPELVAHWRHREIWLTTLATVLLSILIVVTWKQVQCWENGFTLFKHTLKHTSNNYKIHHALGGELYNQGRTAEAIEHYLQALRIKPDYEKAYNNMGVTMEKQGRIKEAVEHYLEALRIKPDYASAHYNLGNALNKQGRTQEAIEHFLHVLRTNPDSAVHNSLGNALDKQGRMEEAIGHYRQALRIKPDYVEAHNNLGNALDNQGRTKEAISHYLEALRIKPDYVDAHYNLGVALFHKGNIEGAIARFREAVRINPDYIIAKDNLKKILMMKQQSND